MKSLLKRICLIGLVVLMVLPLAACGDKKDDEAAAYITKFQTSINALAQTNVTFTKSLQECFTAPDDAAKNKAMIEALTALETGYTNIGTEALPKKFEAVKPKLDEGIKLALSGLAIYKEQLSTLTAATFNEALVKKLEEGDGIMKQANDVLIEASDMITKRNELKS